MRATCPVHHRTIVAQHVTLCTTSNLLRRLFPMKPRFSSFMKPILWNWLPQCMDPLDVILSFSNFFLFDRTKYSQNFIKCRSNVVPNSTKVWWQNYSTAGLKYSVTRRFYCFAVQTVGERVVFSRLLFDAAGPENIRENSGPQQTPLITRENRTSKFLNF
jgi:hypothetical protein